MHIPDPKNVSWKLEVALTIVAVIIVLVIRRFGESWITTDSSRRSRRFSFSFRYHLALWASRQASPSTVIFPNGRNKAASRKRRPLSALACSSLSGLAFRYKLLFNKPYRRTPDRGKASSSTVTYLPLNKLKSTVDVAVQSELFKNSDRDSSAWLLQRLLALQGVTRSYL